MGKQVAGGKRVRSKHPLVLTANRLVDGAVVYRAASGWVEAVSDAQVYRENEAAQVALDASADDVAARLIVDPYVFDVADEPEGPRPLRTREIIRAKGPTVRPDLGKQAELDAALAAAAPSPSPAASAAS
ncbi:MAG: DUF2849 domain-containing protein [Pseudomonadota bacterium]